MKTIKTPILPVKPYFVKVKNQPHELDYKAICVFSAFGFFLNTDTYWKDEKVLVPGSISTIDDEGYLIDSNYWFKWYYKPQKINLEKAVEDFGALFEKIVSKQSLNRKVILPLSGGLDSRSQAVALNKIGADVKSYSYSFENGYKESNISKKIAKSCNFPFKEFTITKSYLWDRVHDLSKINGCYSEFTHPRQMAVIDEISKLGNSFSLGHWGDVLFDSDAYPDNSTNEELLGILKKKVVKKGGLELAKSLWNNWNLAGDFESYLDHRIIKLLGEIEIKNTNAKLRAFKSLYWAPRWTSVNLSIFESKQEIQLPYYDDEMCKFICSIPEELLANRKIQIEYIKTTNAEVANIVWQDAKPFNLHTYHLAKFPYNFPYRVAHKFKRIVASFWGKKFVQRNWELQFLGKENQDKLSKYLFSKELTALINKDIIHKYHDLFYQKNQVYYSHAVSMLLTLSLFLKRETNE
ncbi:MAG: hypothetical protein ACI9Z4_000692 [Polaribacter sp.]|jgi:hypothetical protein